MSYVRRDGINKKNYVNPNQGKISNPLQETLPIEELFMQNVFMKEYSNELSAALKDEKYFYHQEKLSEIVLGTGQFPDSL